MTEFEPTSASRREDPLRTRGLPQFESADDLNGEPEL